MTDGQIPQNNGCYTVLADGRELKVARDDEAVADLACDIAGLSALVTGRHAFGDAADMGAVQVLRNEAIPFAQMLFGEKQLHINHNF